MLQSRYHPQDIIQQGQSPKGRKYILAPNANNGRLTIYLYDLFDAEIASTKKKLLPESEELFTVEAKSTIGSIEIDESVEDSIKPSRIFSIVTQGEMCLEQELYRLAKNKKQNIFEDSLTDNSFFYFVSLLVFSLSLLSFNFLPKGGVPDSFAYVAIVSFGLSVILSALLRNIKGMKKLLSTIAFFGAFSASIIWINASRLNMLTQEGTIVEIIKNDSRFAPTVFRVLRKDDLKMLSLIIERKNKLISEGSNIEDFEVNDRVIFDTYTGMLGLESEVDLRLAQ